MAFFVRSLTHYEEITIQSLLEQTDTNPVLIKRLRIIWLSHQRVKSGEISRQLEVLPPTVVRWIKRFNQKGLVGLEERLEELPTRAAAEEASEFGDTPHNTDMLYTRPLAPLETATIENLIGVYHERKSTLKRLQAILLSSQSTPISRISIQLGLSRGAVRLWIKQFNREGLESLQTDMDKEWLARQQTLIYTQ